MSQHKNKLNKEKRGHDKIFQDTTKVLTQCKEVLSRHNKLGRDRMIKLNIEESYRDMKNGSQQ